MKFCITTNLKTNKTYYYIDGDRRTKDSFEFSELLQRVSGKDKNSLQFIEKNNFRRFTYYYN